MKKPLFLVPLMFIIMSSCGENKAYSRDIFAMDTYMSVKAYGKSAENTVSECEKLIHQLDSELSVTDEKSCIYKLNASKGEPVEVTENASEIIRDAKKISLKTNGALDITMLPLVKEWGFIDGSYHIPESETIADLLENVGYQKIQLSDNTVTIPEGFQIDLGSVAKGYTGDKVIDMLKESGIKSAIISLGGNVQTLGRKTDGSEWKVAVRDPFQPDEDMCILSVTDKAVVTSGNYERFFIGEDGKKYCHIFDPENGYPADKGLVSVTVIGDRGLICDALSTAVFVAGEQRAMKIISEYTDYDFIMVTDSGKILYTDGISDKFQNISSMPAEETKK